MVTRLVRVVDATLRLLVSRSVGGFTNVPADMLMLTSELASIAGMPLCGVRFMSAAPEHCMEQDASGGDETGKVTHD